MSSLATATVICSLHSSFCAVITFSRQVTILDIMEICMRDDTYDKVPIRDMGSRCLFFFKVGILQRVTIRGLWPYTPVSLGASARAFNT